jgi:PHP domain
MYIELHARSAFSFLEGASLPEELAGVCAHLGMPAMALLDTDGVYGAPRFHLAAKKAKIKAHIGAEVTCDPLHPVSATPHSVVLSGASASRSEALAESKDLYAHPVAQRAGIPRFARNEKGMTREIKNGMTNRRTKPFVFPSSSLPAPATRIFAD